jgi:hypothetical protein
MGGDGESGACGASGDEGGDSRLGKGEKQISLHGVGDGDGSRRSSASFLRFLGFFRGGGAFPGDIPGSAGCGAWTAVEAAAEGETRTGASGAAVAARPRLRWRRRRSPAAAVDSAGIGKMHDRDSVCRPAA